MITLRPTRLTWGKTSETIQALTAEVNQLRNLYPLRPIASAPKDRLLIGARRYNPESVWEFSSIRWLVHPSVDVYDEFGEWWDIYADQPSYATHFMIPPEVVGS